MSCDIIILAAGQGKRMCSTKPKVLHTLAGQPMLERVIETAQRLKPEHIYVIIGHEGDVIQKQLAHCPVIWIWQTQRLGTGHAVMQVLPHLSGDHPVLILSGDVPLIQHETLQTLITQCARHPQSPHVLGLLIAQHQNPYGLGRIVRNNAHHIQAIVEEKDATEQERRIQEIYTGICYAHAADLARWLPALDNQNAQQEYYLTKILEHAVAEDMPIVSHTVYDEQEIQGVNDRLQLQQLERALQKRMAERLMLTGVSLADAARLDVRGHLHCEHDVFIDVNNVFQGHVILGEHTHIEPHCILSNVTVGKNCRILSHSVLEDCVIGDQCIIGPFARIRPKTHIAHDCKVGNFVELKNAHIDAHTKVNHLSYLGDVTVGKNVNIGAGTITCNYDGTHKYHTIIEDGVFIGSDTQLVAPLIVEKHATIGAGSTIRKNVPAYELTLTTSTQQTRPGWKRPQERNKKSSSTGRLSESFITANWRAPAHIQALTTTRLGYDENNTYAHNNLALHVGDEASHVQKNRDQLKQILQLPSDPVWLDQTHSTHCIIAEEETTRCADAAITRDRNIVLAIMTADCVPIVLCDNHGREIAAIHAGWKGLAHGIIEQTLMKMQHAPHDLMAWIGPAICGSCYAIQDAMKQTFLQQYPYVSHAFHTEHEQMYANLPRIAELILHQNGLLNVFQSNCCTFERENTLYSYRRTPQTGRMATLIWFKKDE